jgi:hypothetical protein
MNNKMTLRLSLLLVFLFLAATLPATNYGLGGDTTEVKGHYGASDSTVIICPATSPDGAGTLDSAILFSHDDWHGPHTVNVLIFRSDSTLLDTTNDFYVNTSTDVRYKSDFVNKSAIAASTAYLVGIHLASAGGVNGAMWLCRKTASTTPTWRFMTGQATIPTTFVTGSSSSAWPMSLWCFYSSAGGVSTSQVIMIDGDD